MRANLSVFLLLLTATGCFFGDRFDTHRILFLSLQTPTPTPEVPEVRDALAIIDAAIISCGFTNSPLWDPTNQAPPLRQYGSIASGVTVALTTNQLEVFFGEWQNRTGRLSPSMRKAYNRVEHDLRNHYGKSRVRVER
jgi:hypothetical protein